MTIPCNNVHGVRVLRDIYDILIQYQFALHDNALLQKQRALAQNQPLEELQKDIANMLSQYQDKISQPFHAFIKHLQSQESQLFAFGKQVGMPLSDAVELEIALSNKAQEFAEMPKGSYKEIVRACDFLISEVPYPTVVFP